MEMDFLGPRSSPWQPMRMPPVPRRNGGGGEPWRFAAPPPMMLHAPDVPAAHRHPVAPSSEVRASN
jgi:hypothetical protein